jgi:hypothetical protein
MASAISGSWPLGFRPKQLIPPSPVLHAAPTSVVFHVVVSDRCRSDGQCAFLNAIGGRDGARAGDHTPHGESAAIDRVKHAGGIPHYRNRIVQVAVPVDKHVTEQQVAGLAALRGIVVGAGTVADVLKGQAVRRNRIAWQVVKKLNNHRLKPVVVE